MRHFALQTLTWGTVAAAVVSALWLAAVDLGWSELRSPFNGESVFSLPDKSSTSHGRSQAPDTERRNAAEIRRAR
jgi:hypothetical protein